MSKSLIHAYIEDIAKRIYDSSLYGSASVMIGAGFSKNADVIGDESSSPSWEELGIKMFEALYKKPSQKEKLIKWEVLRTKKTSGKNILRLAEEYKSVFGRNELNKFIERNLKDDLYIPGALHKKLLSLKWRDVFTTNYDTLLERTIGIINSQYSYRLLLHLKDLPGSTHPRIIKLHGTVNSGDDYIICEEDYRTYPIKYAPMVNTVQQAMLETQLCLIGFSGDDPNFLSWLGWLRDNMGENCPNIYLIGLFQNMSSSEKKTLEMQNIIILDLAELFEDSEQIDHKEALDAFVSQIIKYGEEKAQVFGTIPYEKECRSSQFSELINEEYFQIMENYLNSIIDKTRAYVAFQNNIETSKFVDALSIHFEAILNVVSTNEHVETLSKITNLLRKGFSFLEDSNAERLRILINSIQAEELKSKPSILSAYTDLAIYVLQMYRIDGRYKEYAELLEMIEETVKDLEGYSKEDLRLEKSKFYISAFDYDRAKAEINIINHKVALDIQIKKVFLLKQIGEEERAIDLLREASSILAQRKYSDNLTASLKGFINLCSRSLLIPNLGENDVSFSDEEYYLNGYNVRNIYNQLKHEVSTSLLLVQNENKGERLGFNLGTSKMGYSTPTKKEQEALIKPFKYIMFHDLVCSPNIFSDQREFLALALNRIEVTSANPIWKWSSVIRTDNAEIIDSYFTRDLIFSADKRTIDILIDQLFRLLETDNKEGNAKWGRCIIRVETIFDVLSRFSIVMNDEKVIRLCHNILEWISRLDKHFLSKPMEYFIRTSSSLNSKICAHFFDFLLESNSLPPEVLYIFADASRKDDSVKITESKMDKVIHEIESGDGIRDLGIIKLILIQSLVDIEQYSDSLARAIWGNLTSMGFPKSTILNILFWKDLPRPQEVDLDQLYINFLNNPKFPKLVFQGGVKGMSDVDKIIYEYIRCFYSLSDLRLNRSKVLINNWKSDNFVNLIKYIGGYVAHEKTLLNDEYDFLGSATEARKRFNVLRDFIGILIAISFIADSYNAEVENEVKRVKDIFREIGISIASVQLIQDAVQGSSMERKIDDLIEKILDSGRESVDEAMNTLEALLIIEDKVEELKISDRIIKLIDLLLILDANRNQMIIRNLTKLILHPCFAENENVEKIVSIFEDIIVKYKSSEDLFDRDLMEVTYTFSVLVNNFYHNLIESGNTIPVKLIKVIDKIKRSKLKEVRLMWDDLF